MSLDLRIWSVLSFALTLGCGGPDPDTSETDDAGPDSWEVLVEGLDGAALSLWGTSSTDLWVASGNPSGGGDVAHHWDGSTLSTVDLGVTAHMWWVTSRGEEGDPLWFVGEESTIVRYEPATQAPTTLATGGGAKLFGAWASPDGTLWAVGGVPGEDDSAVILHVDGDDVTLVNDDLPAVKPGEVWFKVFGTAADDLWVIGDAGSVMHYDGTWARHELDGAPRLVTIHGNPTDSTDLVIVGGVSAPKIFEKDPLSWPDVSPSTGSGLNGVFVSSSGDALASGNDAYVLLREDGFWSAVERPKTFASFHAAWMDENGDLYVGGGNLGTTPPSDGIIMKYTR